MVTNGGAGNEVVCGVESVVATGAGEGDGLGSGAAAVVVGDGVVVSVGGELDVVAGAAPVGGGVVMVSGSGGGGFGAVVVGSAASGVSCASATAATGGTASVRIDRPPLPLTPGGTGPGADGIRTTPVTYACAHASTMST